jgi:hypothetical protein
MSLISFQLTSVLFKIVLIILGDGLGPSSDELYVNSLDKQK